MCLSVHSLIIVLLQWKRSKELLDILLAAQPLLRVPRKQARPFTGEVPGPTEGGCPSCPIYTSNMVA